MIKNRKRQMREQVILKAMVANLQDRLTALEQAFQLHLTPSTQVISHVDLSEAQKSPVNTTTDNIPIRGRVSIPFHTHGFLDGAGVAHE